MSAIETVEAELFFGDLNLLGSNISPEGVQFTLIAQARDAATGNPAPIDTAVRRWLLDGAIVASQGYDNRELFFWVEISADSAQGLAAGEAALVARSMRRTTLTWVGPAGRLRSKPVVFEVETSHLEGNLDTEREMVLTRVFGLRLTALPWVRAEDLTVTPALPVFAVPTVTTVDACTSLTGWAGFPNTPTLVGGTSIRESETVTPPASTGVSGNPLALYGLALIRTGHVDTGGLAYLQLDASSSSVEVSVDGHPLQQVASNSVITWWELPAGMTGFDSLRIQKEFWVRREQTTAIALTVNDVSLTDTPGLAGTGHTSLRSIDVGGTVNTYGSIHVASPSGGLGKVLLHTAPDCRCGYNPAMRRYRNVGSSGTVSTDAACMSGAREPIHSATVRFDPTAAQLPPGDYVFIARAKCAAVEDVDIEVGTTVGAAALDVRTARVSFDAADTWQWCVLGKYRLPPLALPPEAVAAQLVGITLHADTGTVVTLDDLYVLAYSDDPRAGGTITLVDAGTATHLWVDSPDGADRQPHYYAGTAADRTDAIGIDHTDAIQAFGAHTFDPAGSTVFTVTEDATLATVDFTHYIRGHSNL